MQTFSNRVNDALTPSLYEKRRSKFVAQTDVAVSRVASEAVTDGPPKSRLGDDVPTSWRLCHVVYVPRVLGCFEVMSVVSRTELFRKGYAPTFN
jgi:hypothetical protein